MKKILAAILAAVMILSATAVTASAVPVDEQDATPDVLIDGEETVAPTDEPDKSYAYTSADPPTEAPTELSTEPTVPEKADPGITAVLTVSGGLKPEWTAYEGAAKYRLFTKNGTSWKKVADTADLFYVHKGLTAYTEYIYTVRAMDKDGKYISGYDKAGFAFTYLPVPELKSVESVYGGMKFTWISIKGAKRYKVYVKSGTAWKVKGYTSSTSYTDNDVTAGKSYTYTVRVCDPQDKSLHLSFYVTKGMTGKYLASPEITGFTPISGGIRVKYTATDGAAKYRVFIKNGKSWTKVADTAKTYADHLKLTDGTAYTYTVRAMDKNNRYISGFEPAGKSYTYIAPPKIKEITAVGDSLRLSWNAVTGASGYRAFRKEYGKGWSILAETPELTYTDDAIQQDTLYGYTLRTLDASGMVNSYFINDVAYYINGALANGKYTVNGSPVCFIAGFVRQGYVTIDGKMYYYSSSGVLQKDGLVGTKAEGFRYADKNGVINTKFTGVVKNSKGYWYLKKGVLDFTLRDGVTYNGSKWNVIDGKAHKVTSEEDKTLYRAFQLLNKVVKDRTQPKVKQLKIMWDYIKNAYVEKNPRIPHYHGMDWPIIYANDMLINGVGNCMSYGAELCYLAKCIGYDNIYACNSGGHGWAEIDGLVYDPEWSRHFHVYNYFGLSYNTKTDQNYKGAISSGKPWMHVKICANY